MSQVTNALDAATAAKNGQSPVAGLTGTLTLSQLAPAMEKLSSAIPKSP